MFAIEPHLWLQQSFDPAWMLPLMLAISTWGYIPAFALTTVLTLALSGLRSGMRVALAIVLMSGAVALVKYHSDLPRPSDVDVRVLDDGRPGSALVAHGGAKGLWDLPTPEAIDAFRAQGRPRNPGFLSGHTGVTTAVCTALLLTLGVRQCWLLPLLVGVPAIMALSRMYLGRHFLADVLAGWGVGLAMGALAIWLLPRPASAAPAAGRDALWLLLSASILISLLTPGLPVTVPGALAGIVLACRLLDRQGWPDDPETWRQRARRLGWLVLILGMLALAGWGLRPWLTSPAPAWLSGCLIAMLTFLTLVTSGRLFARRSA